MKYALFLLIPFFTACEEPLSLNENQVNRINYAFHDASVAPQYHRSFTISVEPTRVLITVDSYGDILAEKTYELQENAFYALIETINQAELGSIDVESEGCDGGTSESLSITESNNVVYVASIDNCGGTEIPTSAGDFEGVTKAICALVPDLKQLLE